MKLTIGEFRDQLAKLIHLAIRSNLPSTQIIALLEVTKLNYHWSKNETLKQTEEFIKAHEEFKKELRG